ncbi:transferase [Gamsiella multidivaricata]|uniref:transferase n=1 Tax=Gamsiella multidivaricata TaxID=101098 RepID=UPI002220B83D|nr:transferase [Gamsiella multidivaricata]KAI7817751.1 transferase [Gamsiella multidivaricata]
MAVETYTILPTNKYNRPPPPSTIALHGLDLLNPPIQIHNHRFYHRPTNTTSDVIHKLKSSLAEALELYPPVAGTVQANEEGEPYIAMDAENILGTPFLVNMKDTPYAGDTEDLSPRTVMLLPPSSSTLAVKVTQFSCGTIAVAASIHHQVADLRGFLDFLELWAQLARGEAVDFTKIPDDWSHNPGRFFPGLISESTVPTSPPPPFMVLPAPATGPPPFLLAPSEITRWKFTKSSMERLKSDFSPSASASASSKEHKSDLWISSGDALAALLCGVITRARNNANVARLQGRSSLESQTEEIAMAANGRDRSPLDMSGRYFGNFNTLWSATVSRADLSSPICESGSRVALAIRNALNLQLSPEAIAYKISFFEAPQNTQPPGRIDWFADIILTNWCQFDLQGPKLDFGWGKPFCATAGGGSVYPPGYCMMTQEKDSGDVFVMMTVEKEGADGLKADSLLNKYATPVPVHPSC